jgi:hypothetical protein
MRWAGYVARTVKRRSVFSMYLWVNLSEEEHLENQGIDRK